jgi:hypothetical protein
MSAQFQSGPRNTDEITCVSSRRRCLGPLAYYGAVRGAARSAWLSCRTRRLRGNGCGQRKAVPIEQCDRADRPVACILPSGLARDGNMAVGPFVFQGGSLAAWDNLTIRRR